MLKESGRKTIGRLAFLLCMLASPLHAMDEQPTKEQRSTISVSGSAQVNVAPDQMVISGSIESREKTLPDASAANAKIVKSMRAAMKAMEISPNDISTERITISAIKDSPNRRSSKAKQQIVQTRAPLQANNPFGEEDANDRNQLKKPVGFSVVRHFVITISDLNSYEKIYTALVESGVTEVDNVLLKTTELRKHRDLARLAAVKAAREKATAMAGVLNANLAGVKSIQETGNSFHNPFQNITVAFGRDEIAPAGTMKVSAAVDIEFYLGDADFTTGK